MSSDHPDILNVEEFDESIASELGEEYERSFYDTPTEDKTYKNFRDGEDIPVHTGLYVENISNIETDYWDRTGQKGAFINLYGMQRLDDIHYHEIEPRGETKVQQHFYDELVYVLQGSGSTEINEEVQFEWNEGSLFYIPLNAKYKHLNLSTDVDAKLISNTHLPQLMNLIKDTDAIFNNDYDPFEENEFDYQQEGNLTEFYKYEDKYDDLERGPAAWDADLVPDIDAIEDLKSFGKVGAMKLVYFPFEESGMYGHLSELPIASYKNAHRHGPGANILILEGEGYELIWPEDGDTKIKIPWNSGTLYTPPTFWYHQHFNLSSFPAKHFVLHGPRFGSLNNNGILDGHRHVIDYHEEDADVRNHFEKELAERERESNMPEECYSDPEYEFYPGEEI